MNTKKYLFIALITLLLLSVGVSTALAVHDLGLFELDRNATDEAGDGEDWATLDAGGGSAADFTGIIEDTMATNPFGTVGTQFQAGGSKDDLDISPGGATGQYWKWDPGEPLDKDDITNAYAAAYINTVDTGENNIGDLIVYFGLDRFANNGSAQVGFWFLQDPGFGLTTIKDGGGFQFSGHHMIGDILVQSNFTQGGIIDTISVYKWVGSGGSEGTLDLLFNAQDCLTPGLGDDPACATVNQGDTSSPWPFVPKFGTSGTFPQGSFFEGGINISYLVPDAGCFTGFLAETRSSTPFDSRLKDFAYGDFSLCSIAVTKDGDTLSKVGDQVDYTITITNTGAIELFKDDISDTLLGDQTGAADCGASLAPGASCTIMVGRDVQAGDPDPLPNTVTVTYNSKDDFSGTAVSASDDHSVNLFQPSITFDKSVSASLSKVGDSVDYTLTLNNTSSSDTPDLECTITDSALGIDKSVTLASGASDVTNQSYTFEEGDADPYVNTANVSCSPVGFGNVLTASDGESVDLFQPSISFDKSVSANLSKVGDSVDYTLTLNNTSSSDTPDLECTITDATLGIDKSVTLASGASDVTNQSYTFQEGDPDPYNNTANVSCSPVGFPNVLTASDSESVNLFQPSITFDKTGDALSKVGDDVNYTLTLNNTSSADTPDMECTVTDAMLGIDKSVTLASGANDVTNATYTVLAGDPDPLVNTANVSCSPVGFPNELTASDGHSVNLFQPSITFDKSVSANLSKVGDSVDYTLTLNNTSSGDSPDLECTITDLTLGISKSVTLASGASDVTNQSHTFEAGDPDPYDNTADVSCSPVGFPNVLTASDSESVNLFQPSITFDKSGDALSKVGDDVNYTLTLNNTSSADSPDMECTVTDAMLGIDKSVTLASGASDVTNAAYTVQPGDPDPLVNSASVSCSPVGFPNELTASDGHSVNLFQPSITFDKSVSAGLSKVGDSVDYTLTLNNTSSGDSPDLECTITDSTLGISKPVTLASGASDVTTQSHTFVAGDPDPYVNTASVSCSPVGFPNVLPASDSESVNLFQPSITFDKTGDPLSKVGDDVNYTLTLNNTSSADTPAMECTVTDAMLGISKSVTLASGASDVTNAGYTVQAGDPDPLVNSASASCSPVGFPNVLDAGDGHSVELFQPAVEVIKGGPATAARGDTITYNFTINNLSSGDSPNLILDSVTDTVLGDLTGAAAAGGCASLAPGGSCSFTFDYTIAFDDPSPLVNVVTVHYHPADFPNDITDDDDHSVSIPIQGCTPGFWQGGAGSVLWDQVDDEQWVYGGTNPFIHTTLFNNFFNAGPVDSRLDGLTMFDLVGSGGTSDPARKAARDMVAAYLNESAFPNDFPATSLADLLASWYAAVAGGDAGLAAFHNQVSNWNSPASPGYCPLP